MGYKEKFEEYKQGKLEGGEKERIDNDIERQRVIGDYLEENIDSAIFEEHKGADVKTGAEDGELSKLVQKAVSRKLKKFGIWTGAIVLAVTLFLMFGLSPLVDAMYYDPGTELSQKWNNKIDMPLAVYTELHLPGKYYMYSLVEDEGFARYKIELGFESVSGHNDIQLYQAEIDKGQMKRDGTNWQEPTNALFSRWIGGEDNVRDDSEDILKLQKLPETVMVTATMTFKEDLGLSAIKDFHSDETKVIYVPVRVAAGESDDGMTSFLYGFAPEWSRGYYIDSSEYLCLNLQDTLIEDTTSNSFSVKTWETHFKSLLKYMSDQKELNNMILGAYNYPAALKYVEENGVKTFGVIVYGPVGDILRLRQDSRVLSMFVMDAQLASFGIW